MRRRFFCSLLVVGLLRVCAFAQALVVYNPANGHYYENVETPFIYADARADAASRSYMGYHGYLVSVTSKAENDFLISSLGTLLYNHWMGATKPASAWQWLSGETWGYTNWNPGEPSGDGSQMAYMGPTFPLGVWNDTNGNVDRRGYIVEYSGFDISGAINFEDIVAVAAPQDVTFVFQPVNGGSAITQVLSVPVSGAFTSSIIPPGQYTLHIKSAKYLASNVRVDSSQGLVSNVQATLRAGDGDNNNVVDIADFGILVRAYGSLSSDAKSGYDIRADFNSDGRVDLADFSLLLNNYLARGDM